MLLLLPAYLFNCRFLLLLLSLFFAVTSSVVVTLCCFSVWVVAVLSLLLLLLLLFFCVCCVMLLQVLRCCQGCFFGPWMLCVALVFFVPAVPCRCLREWNITFVM